MRQGGAFRFRAQDISVRLQTARMDPALFLYELPPTTSKPQIVVLGAAPTWETKHRTTRQAVIIPFKLET